MTADRAQDFNANEADRMVLQLKGRRRILLWGEMGAGKSTLSLSLARLMNRLWGPCQIMALDPGSPPFGLPGALSRGWWRCNTFEWGDIQALCTLNAARFRLPLVLAARHLLETAERAGEDPAIVIDPPGVVRGAGGAELLGALTECLNVDMVVVLFHEGKPLWLANELASLPMKVLHVPASPHSRRPTKRERAVHRTKLWDRHLADGVEKHLDLNSVHLLGTPPPFEAPDAWMGRQAALLDAAGKTLQMGEVIDLKEKDLIVRIPAGPGTVSDAIVIRDAGRNAAGKLETVLHVGQTSFARHVPAEMTPPPVAQDAGRKPVSSRVGPAWATLVGGIFGDPLVHVRLRNLKESFLFDLGDPGRLAAKVAHQVSTVFLSHAHIDHIGGFLWFLRSRIGFFGPCRIFGPLKTITRIERFLDAITWDRIEANAPVFEVCAFDGVRLRRARLQPGRPKAVLSERHIQDGIILAEDNFNVRAVVCDHNIPSVAYALVFRKEISVRKEKLAASGWPPGPWLGRLKQSIAFGNQAVTIALPDGTAKCAGELAEALTFIRPGKKLVYAADMADTPRNRDKLIELARSAHTLFCETAFSWADRDRAEATQHLTTRAAANIARKAGVERLVPFHFSKRYEHDPSVIYEEILGAAGPVKVLGHF